MTDDKIALQALLEKSLDASLLREMIGYAAQRLMELETARRTAPGSSSPTISTASGPTSGALPNSGR